MGDFASLTSLFNAVVPGIALLVGVAGLGYSFRRFSGQTQRDKNIDCLVVSGEVDDLAYTSFKENEKLKSVIIEGNNKVSIFLRDKGEEPLRTASFDLNDKKEVFMWWKAQQYLDNPEKIYDMAQGSCTEDLPGSNTIADARHKEIRKRNRNLFHPNFITKSGSKFDLAMVSQARALLNAPVGTSSSGSCHIALKTCDADGNESIIVRPVMGGEVDLMVTLGEEGAHKTIERTIKAIPAHLLIERLVAYHQEEIKDFYSKHSASRMPLEAAMRRPPSYFQYPIPGNTS